MKDHSIFKGAAGAFLLASASVLAACSSMTGSETEANAVAAAAQAAPDPALDVVIAARSDDDKARDGARNPAETLRFFGLEADDTVVEALPGGGWYTKIILPYVAANGRYAGVNYQEEMFPLIIRNISEERLERLRTWPETFPAQAQEFLGRDDVPVGAFKFGEAPEDMTGEVDMILMIRALHNLNRVGGDYLDTALSEAYALLKPGGVLGVVQHRASEETPDEAATGSRGYLKQSAVIALMDEAGFVFEESSEINANPKDQPTAEEFVWRLPPTLALGDENRDAMVAIGESDRMTLRFRKPAK